MFNFGRWYSGYSGTVYDTLNYQVKMFSLYKNNCDLFAPMDQKEQLINGSVSLTKSNYIKTCAKSHHI